MAWNIWCRWSGVRSQLARGFPSPPSAVAMRDDELFVFGFGAQETPPFWNQSIKQSNAESVPRVSTLRYIVLGSCLPQHLLTFSVTKVLSGVCFSSSSFFSHGTAVMRGYENLVSRLSHTYVLIVLETLIYLINGRIILLRVLFHLHVFFFSSVLWTRFREYDRMHL